MTAGVKTVAVTYAGDSNFTGNFTTANFTVHKHTPVITVNVTDISVGDIALINITAPIDITNPVIININGTEYAVNVTSGIGQLPILGLSNGTYNVTVRYTGDDKYLSANNTTSFNVAKVNSTVTVTAGNTTVGNVAIIELTVQIGRASCRERV